jgi:5-methylcytosine-specific restriction enzyme A
MHRFRVNNTWKFVRKHILMRDRYTCGLCGERKVKKQLDVDHIIPVTMGINPFDKDNLRALCKECHKAKTALDRGALSKSKKH